MTESVPPCYIIPISAPRGKRTYANIRVPIDIILPHEVLLAEGAPELYHR